MAVTTLQDVAAHLLSERLNIASKNFRSKIVLLRVDFNVPVTNNIVTDWSRLISALPTIKHLIRAGARTVLASHFGRPDPRKQSLADMRAKYSLAPVADHLRQELEDVFVGLAPDCIGPDAEHLVASLKDGQVLLLENTRFHEGDASNSDDFSAALARLADVFVNDAFGVCHRDQGSVTGVTKYIKDTYPGFLVRNEVQYLLQTLRNPKRPFACVVGGAKVADKIGVLWSLIERADTILVGGRMAYTFLAAIGVEVGATQIEHDWLQRASAMVEAAKVKGAKLILPVDCVGTRDLNSSEPCCTIPLTVGCCTPAAPCIPSDAFGADIGPASRNRFVEELETCKTVFWNGPMGRAEVDAYAGGTRAIAHALAAMTGQGATTIVGGGDSVAAISQLGLTTHFSHVSTGGGASLELIEGKGMPGLRALAR